MSKLTGKARRQILEFINQCLERSESKADVLGLDLEAFSKENRHVLKITHLFLKILPDKTTLKEALALLESPEEIEMLPHESKDMAAAAAQDISALTSGSQKFKSLYKRMRRTLPIKDGVFDPTLLPVQKQYLTDGEFAAFEAGDPNKYFVYGLDDTQRMKETLRFENGFFVDEHLKPVTVSNLEYNITADGKLIVLHSGDLKIIPMYVPQSGATANLESITGKRVSHSSLTRDGVLTCAGYITIADGKILAIDTNSGHYKPTEFDLRNAVELLKKQYGESIFYQGCCFSTAGHSLKAQRSYFGLKDFEQSGKDPKIAKEMDEIREARLKEHRSIGQLGEDSVTSFPKSNFSPAFQEVYCFNVAGSQSGALSLMGRLKNITIRDNQLFDYFKLAENPTDRKLIADRISAKFDLNEIIQKADNHIVALYLSVGDETKKGLRDILVKKHSFPALLDIADKGLAKDKYDIASLHQFWPMDARFMLLYQSMSEDEGKEDIRKLLLVENMEELIPLASSGSHQDRNFVLKEVLQKAEKISKLYDSYRINGFSTLLQSAPEAVRTEVAQILIRDLPASKKRLLDVLQDPNFDRVVAQRIINTLFDPTAIDKTIAIFENYEIASIYTMAMPQEKDQFFEKLMTIKNDARRLDIVCSILESPAMDSMVALNIASKIMDSTSVQDMDLSVIAGLVGFVSDENQDKMLADLCKNKAYDELIWIALRNSNFPTVQGKIATFLLAEEKNCLLTGVHDPINWSPCGDDEKPEFVAWAKTYSDSLEAKASVKESLHEDSSDVDLSTSNQTYKKMFQKEIASGNAEDPPPLSPKQNR